MDDYRDILTSITICKKAAMRKAVPAKNIPKPSRCNGLQRNNTSEMGDKGTDNTTWHRLEFLLHTVDRDYK